MKRLLLLLLLASPVFAQQSSSSTGNITATGANCLVTNACISITLANNVSSITVTTTGTFTATGTFESSADNGTTWTSQGTVTTATVTNFTPAAWTNFRVRCSAFTSGTMGVFINTSIASVVAGSGATITGSPATGNLTKFSAATTITNGDLSGDVTTAGTLAATVVKINGTTLSALGTGIVKNTTGTGVPSIAVAADFPATLTRTIASGTSALATGAITSATCATVVTTSATGTLTTDTMMADFNGDPTAVTGYAASASGMLTIIKYPTVDNVNFKVCNNTAGSITPGAITLNWRVVR